MNPLEPAASEAVNEVSLPLVDAPVPGRLERDFTTDDLPPLRHAVHDTARAAGLSGDPLDDFVIAVHELTTNAIRHGGGRGRLELRRDGVSLVCDIIDHGPGFAGGAPVTGRPPSPQAIGGRGLWLAQTLADTMMITDGPGGVTVSITACLPVSVPTALSTVTAMLDTVDTVVAPPTTSRTPAVSAVTDTEPEPPDGRPAPAAAADS